jgi:hypothetical protein
MNLPTAPPTVDATITAVETALAERLWEGEGGGTAADVTGG